MSKLVRIIAHWTAGAGKASALDREHYHFLVEDDGRIVPGKEAPEDNIVTSDGDYAAHTLNLNTGSIGVAVCGMRGAIESPFNPGPSPLTAKQWDEFAMLIGYMCQTHGIPVTPQTVLTHAEVQGTLGVKQRGKWDIARLPFAPSLVGAKAVGDDLRARVSRDLARRRADDAAGAVALPHHPRTVTMPLTVDATVLLDRLARIQAILNER